MKKIVYVCYSPLTTVYENIFYVFGLKDSGISVEYWDLSKAYFKDISFTNVIERDYVRKIDTLKELEKAIKSEDSDTLYFLIITYSIKTLSLYRIFTRNKCRLGFFERGMLPSVATGVGVLKKISKLFSLNRTALISILLTRVACILRKTGYVKKFDIVFAAGSKAYSIHEKTCRVVPVNYFDYDNYMSLRNSSVRIVAGQYVVYLDDNIIDDSDYEIIGVKSIDAQEYYSVMSNYFSLIENKFNVKVVIAAHPKSNYIKNPFSEREIIINKTNDLVKDSLFVLAHYSTSISYAVLYEKPVLFIFTDAMRKKPYFSTILAFAKELEFVPLNINAIKSIDDIGVGTIKKEVYDKYKYLYLTSRQSEKEYSNSIVLKTLTEEAT